MKLLGVISMHILSVAAADLGSTLRTGHGAHAGFGGDKIERTFTKYASLPMNEDELRKTHTDFWGKISGWHKIAGEDTKCDPHLGYAWIYKSDLSRKSTWSSESDAEHYPLVLYTTAGGQLSGVGVRQRKWFISDHNLSMSPSWKNTPWATELQDRLVPPWNGPSPIPQIYEVIDVAFRSGDIVCSGEKDGNLLGDRLIVNPKRAAHSLPLTEQEAGAAGWKRGSCFDGMGWHWFLDTSVGHGKLSWSVDNLFPIVTMYHEGKINAIFFTSLSNQVSIPLLKSNEWEPKSLTSSQMCMNLCDKDCHFTGLTSAGPFSTMHVFFRDHKEVTCASDLHCGISWPLRMNCCETNVVV